MKKRVVFMGGKKPGEACLEILRKHSGVEVVGVIRNIYDYGVYKNMHLHAGNVNDSGNIKQIRELKPDLIICVYYDQILGKEIIDIPPMGCINLHLALAEEYRGCYPTTWALINGETRTGATLHYIDEGIDTGDIISQMEVPIYPQDTGGDLYERCTRAGIVLFESTLQYILDGKGARWPQLTTEKTQYHKREFPSHEIQVDEKTKNRIRALYFPPWPFPYIDIGGRKFYIMEEMDHQKAYD